MGQAPPRRRHHSVSWSPALLQSSAALDLQGGDKGPQGDQSGSVQGRSVSSSYISLSNPSATLSTGKLPLFLMSLRLHSITTAATADTTQGMKCPSSDSGKMALSQCEARQTVYYMGQVMLDGYSKH